MLTPISAFAIVVIEWNYVDGGEVEEVGFEVDRATSSDGTTGNCTGWALYNSPAANVMSLTVPDVTWDCYRVRALGNGVQYPYSDPIVIPAPTPPETPGGFKVVNP